MRPDGAGGAAPGDGPAIVCAQAGNVNSGAFDPLPAIGDAVDARARRAPVWLHVDGAFGLWARVRAGAAPPRGGAERADSWATDAHKWLNTPYDCGIALVRDARAHRRAMTAARSYMPDARQRGAQPVRLHARALAPRARLRAVGGAAPARPRGVRELVERSLRSRRAASPPASPRSPASS